MLLLREQPKLRVLIVEKSAAVTRRVGEATVEVSTYFLTHSLGLAAYLNETQITKQGLRFWFANDRAKDLSECSEIGPRYLARVPAFLVDRAALDEEVLRRAAVLGAELWRERVGPKVRTCTGRTADRSPVRHQEKVGPGQSALGGRRFRSGGRAGAPGEMVAAQHRAPDDGSLVALERRQGLGRAGTGREISSLGPARVMACAAAPPNHLMGDGWWAWLIPLKGGDVSIGVVFDQRPRDLAEGRGASGERLKTFLMQHPVGKELMADAEWTRGRHAIGGKTCRISAPLTPVTVLRSSAMPRLFSILSTVRGWIGFRSPPPARRI